MFRELPEVGLEISFFKDVGLERVTFLTTTITGDTTG